MFSGYYICKIMVVIDCSLIQADVTIYSDYYIFKIMVVIVCILDIYTSRCNLSQMFSGYYKPN